MTESAATTFELTETYLHLDNEGGAARIEVTPAFWDSLQSGEASYDGRLVMAGEISQDMGHWEMHPAGEELLFCHSGAFEVRLEGPEGESAVTLTPGKALVVPRGVWHRFLVREPGQVLFVTWGEGTRHRPL